MLGGHVAAWTARSPQRDRVPRRRAANHRVAEHVCAPGPWASAPAQPPPREQDAAGGDGVRRRARRALTSPRARNGRLVGRELATSDLRDSPTHCPALIRSPGSVHDLRRRRAPPIGDAPAAASCDAAAGRSAAPARCGGVACEAAPHVPHGAGLSSVLPSRAGCTTFPTFESPSVSVIPSAVLCDGVLTEDASRNLAEASSGLFHRRGGQRRRGTTVYEERERRPH